MKEISSEPYIEKYIYIYNHIKDYDDFRYSGLSKKERDAKISPARRSSESPKINRNADCICGSGKKFKKCCYERIDI